eukprot:270886-Rhodomonas_salina.2
MPVRVVPDTFIPWRPHDRFQCGHGRAQTRNENERIPTHVIHPRRISQGLCTLTITRQRQASVRIKRPSA